MPIGPIEAPRALGVILVAVPALYGLGALFAAVVLRFGEVSAMVQTVRGVFTVFCGMTFPIIILPVWAKAVALTLPPTYLIGDLRAVLLTGSDFVSLIPTLAILAAMGLALWLRGGRLPAHRAVRPPRRQPGAVLTWGAADDR